MPRWDVLIRIGATKRDARLQITLTSYSHAFPTHFYRCMSLHHRNSSMENEKSLTNSKTNGPEDCVARNKNHDFTLLRVCELVTVKP